MADVELAAMQNVLKALAPLDPAARMRVLRWSASRFEPSGVGASDGLLESHAFGDVVELVTAAAPSDGPEQALVAGYWFQAIQGQSGWTGSEANSMLRNMGLGLANVTRTLDQLRKRSPPLVMQVKKSGRSKQARKTYTLTSAGIGKVEAMLAEATTR